MESRKPIRSVRAGGGACSLAGGGLFDHGSHVGGDCFQHLKVVSGKGVRAGAVESQNGDYAALPSSGTARAERSVLYCVGLFRYPGSTDGLPFKMGL